MTNESPEERDHDVGQRLEKISGKAEYTGRPLGRSGCRQTTEASRSGQS